MHLTITDEYSPHRAPSTEHRAPSTEHRAPSTERCPRLTCPPDASPSARPASRALHFISSDRPAAGAQPPGPSGLSELPAAPLHGVRWTRPATRSPSWCSPGATASGHPRCSQGLARPGRRFSPTDHRQAAQVFGCVPHRDAIGGHCPDRYATNRAEVFHQPIRQRERQRRRFKSAAQTPRVLSVRTRWDPRRRPSRPRRPSCVLTGPVWRVEVRGVEPGSLVHAGRRDRQSARVRHVGSDDSGLQLGEQRRVPRSVHDDLQKPVREIQLVEPRPRHHSPPAAR